MQVQGMEVCMRILAEEIQYDIPLTQLRMFLFIAANPGVTQTELSEYLKLHQATVSRNVKKMGRELVQGETGFTEVGMGLLETRQDTHFDSRRLACFLTKRGEEIVHMLNKELRRV